MDASERHKSVYHTGAYDGAIMGAVFVALFFAYVYGAKSNIMILDAIGLIGSFVFVPFLLVRMMRKRYIDDNYSSHFSAVWMHGITIMICGNLILGLAIYVFLKFIDPFFINTMAVNAIDAYHKLGSADADAIADTFQKMIDQKLLPSPIQFAFSTMWFGSFFGCIIALILGLLVKAFVRKKKNF